MALSRIEALCGAFANLNGVMHPSSRAYKNKNPLLLRAFSPKHERDEEGYRVFSTFPGGWDNGCLDLKIKCSGESRAHFSENPTLKDLVLKYGSTAAATRKVKNFLRIALNDDSIR